MIAYRIFIFTIFWALWLVYDLPVALVVWGVLMLILRPVKWIIA